jgi:hypothetical protein
MTRVLLFLMIAAPAFAQVRAGVAKVKITPDTPVWLSGFAARSRPAETLAQDLWAKALAIEDAKGSRFVLVTVDLIGLTREITDEVAGRAKRRHGLERRQLLFNASHTHSGPSVWPRLHVARSSGPDVDRQMKSYAEKLISALDDVVGDALGALQPATLEFAEGEATFAINRRKEHLGAVRPGEDFPAPVDPSVPVLRALSVDGRPLAIVFGYACHNTVLTAQFAEISGDYAGHAQLALEQMYPGATALFVTLCAGDQRADVRGTRELAQQHGRTLAESVRTALTGPLRRVAGDIASAYQMATVPFQAHAREVYLAESQSGDTFLARRGRLMLQAFDAGKPVRDTSYPAQAVRIGDGPAWIALGGEVVIDYQLRLKREFGADRVIVLGYSNDVMAYIPSRRVQREGGYEAGDSMMYFSQPGWFTDEVEDIVIRTAHEVLANVGIRPK